MSAGETWALYRQALDASMDGMALLDAAGRYVYANAAHAAAYGFAHAEDLIGQSWRILYDDEGLHFIDEQVFPVLRSQGRWHGQAVGRRRDGSLFPQELSLAFLPDGGLVCVVRDISDRVLAEQAQLLYLPVPAAVREHARHHPVHRSEWQHPRGQLGRLRSVWLHPC